MRRSRYWPGAFQSNGDNVAKKFTVQFTGPAQTAERRVEKVLTLLRQGDGAWRQFFAVSPARRETQLFFGPDKSGKQIKTEMEANVYIRLSKTFTRISTLFFYVKKVSSPSLGCQLRGWRFSRKARARWCIGTAPSMSGMASTKTALSPLFASPSGLQNQWYGNDTIISFRRLFAPWCATGTSTLFGTWNARALLHSTPRRCKLKCKYVERLLYDSSKHSQVVWVLQEVHGSEPQFLQSNHWIKMNFLVFSSFASVGVGGIVSLIMY